MRPYRSIAFVVTGMLLPTACDSGSSQETRTAPTTAAASESTVPTPPPPPKELNVYEATLTGAPLSPVVANVPTRVYVPNSESNTVDVIDPATFEVIDHYSVGKLPQHVTPSWDLKTLYADNTAGNSLTPIDPMTGKPGEPIPVEDPYNLYFTLDGSKAIVVAERLKRLDFRDPQTWELIKSVPVSHAGVDHLDFSADGRYLVASCEFSGWIVKVDTVTMEVVGELEVGGQPIDSRLSPDGKVFFVANQSRNGVHVIDGETMTEQNFISTGKGTHGLYFSRDARSLYATNRLGGSVSVIDVASQQVTQTWDVPGGSPDMGGVSADGTQFWISGRYHSEVYAIDTRTGELLARIKVGRGPHGLAIFPQPGRVSLGHTGNYR